MGKRVITTEEYDGNGNLKKKTIVTEEDETFPKVLPGPGVQPSIPQPPFYPGVTPWYSGGCSACAQSGVCNCVRPERDSIFCEAGVRTY